MAVYTTDEVLDVIFEADFDSGGESDISEDPSFHLPQESDEQPESDGEQLHGTIRESPSSGSDVETSYSSDPNRSRSLPRRGSGRVHVSGRGRGLGRGQTSYRRRGSGYRGRGRSRRGRGGSRREGKSDQTFTTACEGNYTV